MRHLKTSTLEPAFDVESFVGLRAIEDTLLCISMSFFLFLTRKEREKKGENIPYSTQHSQQHNPKPE